MISRQTLGRSFGSLSSYLLTGKYRVHPDQRVGWIALKNLLTGRLDVAIRIMAGTASLSSAEQPVFHLSISFAPGDPAGRELMLRVMLRTLSDLGLGEHQAVIVSHIDTDDPHVHAMVNRVHPETGLAWKGSWSRLRAEASLRRQELEEGLRVVPGWLAPVPGAPELRPKPRLARGGTDFLRDVTERATAVLENATSWAELERGLADLGLAVRVNGRGMSITDGRQEVKASAVGRAFSRAQLEGRFEDRYSDYTARVAVGSAAARGAEPRVAAGSAPMRASGTAESHAVSGGRVAGAERKRAARFTVMEEDGRVYVWDCVGPQIFFAETRERAEAEVQRANTIVARYPNIATVRCLRDMDWAWRDAHGLPRLPESNDRGAWVDPSAAVAPIPPAVIPPPLVLSAPEPDTVKPTFVELRESGPVGSWHLTVSDHTSQEPEGPDRKESGPVRDPEHRLSEASIGPAAEQAELPAELTAEDRDDRDAHQLQVNREVASAPESVRLGELVWQKVVLDESEELAGDTSSSGLEAAVRVAEQVQERRVLAAQIQEANERIARIDEWGRGLDQAGRELGDGSAQQAVPGAERPALAKADPRPSTPTLEPSRGDPFVEEAIRAFAALEEVREAIAQTRAFKEQRLPAETVLATFDRQDKDLALAEEDFKATATKVYRDPSAAMAAWDTLVQREPGGVDPARERVARNPEILGPLLTHSHYTVWGPAAAKLGFTSTRSAREAVPRMLRRAALYTKALRETRQQPKWTAPDGQTVEGRGDVKALAKSVVRDWSAKIEATEAKVRELGDLVVAEHRVQLAFAGLSPAQRRDAVARTAARGAAKGVREADVAASIAEVLGKSFRAARAVRTLGEGPGGL